MKLYIALATVSVFFTLIKDVGSWPEGTYGLPMPKSGCPAGTNFEWETGTRTHQTEPGSKASKDVHLAGIENVASDKIVQTFCMKTSYTQDGDSEFEPGRYCIFKKDSCPDGFKDGWIYWDDDAPWFGPTIQNYSGTIPDGEYDRNTKMFYCCRNDGRANNPIQLPASAPFFLLKWGEICQEVKNMDVTEEWVYWSDESNLNLNGHGGLYPKNIRSKYPSKYTKVFYCYYQPKGPNNALRTTLTVIYILAAVVGLVVFIFFIFCLIQKCCTRKQPAHFIDNNADNSAREAMLAGTSRANGHTPRQEPTVIYRPSANGHQRPNGAVTIDKKYPLPPTPSPPPPGHPHGAAAAVGGSPGEEYPMMPGARITLPPSYDEVIRQKSIEEQDSPPPPPLERKASPEP